MASSLHSPLFGVFAASIDGRLENVRTRHDALRKLSLSLDHRRSCLLQAFQACKNLDTAYFNLALTATLRNLALHAATLDQPRAVNEKRALSKCPDLFTHKLKWPIGVVAVELPEDLGLLSHPIDAIFGPVAAALTAGNCIVIVHHDQSSISLLLKMLEDIFSEALDREVFSFVTASRLSADDWKRFDCIVRYSSTSSPSKEGERFWKLLQIEPQPKNVVVVDHSLVDDRSYRHPDQNPGVTKRQAARLAVIVDAIDDFPSAISHIFVTETIMSLFQQAWAGKARQTQATVSSVLSTQDTIYSVQEQGQGSQAKALNVYIFAKPTTASFYAQQIEAQSVSINGLPKDLGFSYVPSCSSSGLVKGDRHYTCDDFVLEPLWATSLFSKETSTVFLCKNPERRSTNSHRKSTSLSLSLDIAPMKRRRPDHMDFFPTGFKITFFPLALSIFGGLGYYGFRIGMLGYRFVRSHT